MHCVVVEGVASRVHHVVVKESLEQFSLPLDRCCDGHDFFLRGNTWMIRASANCRYLLVPGRSGRTGMSDDLTVAAGGRDAPRRARGFQPALGEIMPRVVVGCHCCRRRPVEWSLWVEWSSLVRYR